MRFKAFTALVLARAKEIQPFAGDDALRKFRSPTPEDAANWLHAQHLLNEAALSFSLTLESAKFGATGWLHLQRDGGGERGFSYTLRLYEQKGGVKLVERSVDAMVIAGAVSHGVSLLAAALMNDPTFISEIRQRMLPGSKGATFESALLGKFLGDVAAPPGSPRSTRL